ncbi:hypothetical protein ACWXVL_00840 [Mycoplasma sp. 128]|uniref:hypothetical protein n=1 Tax=Mycoplasma sp. 3341 TaxID=3447506 RepID=UPI003F65BA82
MTNADFEQEKMMALQAWNAVYGNKQEAEDFAGRKIVRDEYKTDSEFSWEIDVLYPVKKNELPTNDNLMIMSSLTQREKGLNGTFKANNRHFQIRKTLDGYELFEMYNDEK